MCNCDETKRKDRSELGISPCSCKPKETPEEIVEAFHRRFGKKAALISVELTSEELSYVTLLVGNAECHGYGITAYEKLYDKVLSYAVIEMHDLEDNYPSLHRLRITNSQKRY